MGKGTYWISQLLEASALDTEVLPGQTVVEIAGERRVLIENHLGVMAYGQEKILVKAKYGVVSICGCHLEMLHMTREQLVICGRIDSVSLHRRGCV